jgi:hypothetical protein
MDLRTRTTRLTMAQPDAADFGQVHPVRHMSARLIGLGREARMTSQGKKCVSNSNPRANAVGLLIASL